MTTPKLGLDELTQSQANKYLTHNNALRDLDVLVQGHLVSQGDVTPPGSPAEGDAYLVGTSATGDWAGQDGNIAYLKSGVWVFLAPQEGWLFWVDAEDTSYRYDGAAWAEESGGGGGSVAVQDEGSEVVAVATALNFTGGGVTASDAGGGVATINIPGGGAGGAFNGALIRKDLDSRQSFANGVSGNIAFSSEILDTNGFADIGTNNDRITFPSAGTFIVTAAVRCATEATGRALIDLTQKSSADATKTIHRVMDKTFVSADVSTDVDLGTAVISFDVNGSYIIDAAAGDYVVINASNVDIAGDFFVGTGQAENTTVYATILSVSDQAGGTSETTGTFTPTYSPQTNSFTSITYNVQLGYYRRVGRKVEFNVTLQTASLTVGSASGALYLDGLPFTHEATYEAACVCGYSAGWGSLFPMAGKIAANTTQMNFTTQNTTSTGHAIITVPNMDASAGNKNLMNVTGFYFTDDP